jgi:flagellar hook assembly protein FlgD
LRGALVRRISAGILPAGPATVTWAGRDDTGARAASGIYFSRLYLDGSQEGKTLKISLVK